MLHLVPNGYKIRGHIGSELQRKAAAILSIEKDDNPTRSVVKTMKVRKGRMFLYHLLRQHGILPLMER
ncbi:MAG: hypothetical protein LIP02_06140 [Bacteroidales bacterium]|nr:hypothetical protein [Bacteroidales bacterium]